VRYETRSGFAGAAIAVWVLLAPAVAGEQVSPEKEAAIREVVRVTGFEPVGT
jgi:hypothetical protein